MRMLDLFSGIGGFSLAASWVWGDELEIVGFCEIEEYCQKILAKNFPLVPIYSDIRELKGEQFNNIDLITGGFPCQDISVANQNGKGIEGERSGLWKEMHRLISEIRPSFCLLENVAALFYRGLSVVLADLAQIGYDAEWQSISASQIGAPHKRERVWIVAYPRHMCRGNLERRNVRLHSGKQAETSKRNTSQLKITGSSHEPQIMAYPASDGRPRKFEQPQNNDNNQTRKLSQYQKEGRYEIWGDIERGSKNVAYPYSSGQPSGKPGPGEGAFRGRNPSGSDKQWGSWQAEPNVGRVVNGLPSRVDRIKGLGNAIVPQCAALVMEHIKPLIHP